MSSLWPEHLDEIVEEFKDCFDSMERYELLFDYAKNNPNPLPIEEWTCLLYTSPSPRDATLSRMPSSA